MGHPNGPAWDTPTASRGDPNGPHAGKPRKEKNNIETKTNSNDMKRIPVTLLWASSLLLLLPAASCTDTLGGDPDTDARAITFTPAAETRAAVETDFPDGSSFSVWGWYGRDSQITNNVFDGETVTKSGEAWTYGGGTQYWIKGKTYNFYGVYPADVKASVTNGGTITIENFDCSATGADAVDLMTATHTRDYDGTNTDAVNMPFKHELARVSIIVKAIGTDVLINKFKLKGVNRQGTFNGSSWKATPCEADDSYFHLNELTQITAGNTANPLGDLLVIPQDNLQTAQLHISYQFGGTTATKEINLGTQINAWNKAQRYTYTLTIQATDLELNVTIKEWAGEDTSVKWD